mgnify:CR=1 FL=1
MESAAEKKFSQRFMEEIIELIVLTKSDVMGAAVCGEYLNPSLEFIACVDVRTGALLQEKGRLEWLIKNTPGRRGWGYNFKQLGIYRIKARKNIPVKLLPYMRKTMNNCYMVLEIVDAGISEPRLEAIKKKLSQPVSILAEGIGNFALNRKFSCFEGHIAWMGASCSVMLDTDEEDGDTAEQAMTALKKFYSEQERWDKAWRSYAAKELTDLANEWQAEDDAQNCEPLTKQIFAQRLALSEMSISVSGDITLYYDDDMFWGHAVEVDANADGEILSAQIVG